jgi:hypothetical protein
MVNLFNIHEEIRQLKQAFYLMFVKPVFLEEVKIEVPIQSVNYQDLKNNLSESLIKFGFKSQANNFFNPQISKTEFWKLRNANINRSVVLLQINQDITLNELVSFIHSIKHSLGKVTGYVTFINEVGMQVIVLCNKITDTETTVKSVDTYSNQRAIIQSLFVVDNANKKYYCSTTVLQTVTSQIQAAIEKQILLQLIPLE